MIKVDIKNEAGEIVKQLTFSTDKVDQSLSIGRLPECEVWVEDPCVSRRHAKISRRGEKYFIEDLASSGGTLLDGAAIPASQPVMLADECNIQVGSCVLYFTFLVPDIEATRMGLATDEATVLGKPTPKNFQPVALVAEDEWETWTQGSIDVTCRHIIQETPDVKTFVFSAKPNTLFHYKPGQFATLHLDIGGQKVTRSYTISSTPSRPHTLTHTIKRVPAAIGHDPGHVSNWLHDHMEIGKTISINGPFGDFTCHNHPSQQLCLISGGSGVTPMLSMTRWLLDTQAAVDIVFIHAAKSESDIIARDELEYLAQRHPNFKLVFILSRDHSNSRWSGYRGRLSAEFMNLAAPDFQQRTVFVCGPAQFMTATKQMLQEQDFAMERYHEESFGGPAATSTDSGVDQSNVESPKFGLKAILGKLASTNESIPTKKTSTSRGASANTTSIRISFATSGTMADYTGGTLLETGEAAGLTLPFGCRQGLCGACKQKLVKGKLQSEGYSDSCLSASDKGSGYVLMCVGRPDGDVEIEA